MSYRIIAIAILAVFYGCYYAKLLFQSKKGIKTDLLGKGKTGTARAVEIGVKTATIICLIAEAVCIFINISMLGTGWRIGGACVAAMGTVIFIFSMTTMSDSWRAGVPAKRETKLVTGGIYKISRNPAFLGFDMVYIGILLMFFAVGIDGACGIYASFADCKCGGGLFVCRIWCGI